MSTKLVSLRIPQDLLDEIDKSSDGSRGRNKWCIQAFRDALHVDSGVSGGLTTQAKVERQETDSQLDLLLDKHLVKRMQSKDVLDKLTDVEIAKLAAQRAPKAQNLDERLMGDVLSLTASLKQLPSVGDITGELNRVKQDCDRLRTDLEFKAGILDVMKNRLRANDAGLYEALKALFAGLWGKLEKLDRGSEARCLDFDDFRGMFRW